MSLLWRCLNIRKISIKRFFSLYVMANKINYYFLHIVKRRWRHADTASAGKCGKKMPREVAILSPRRAGTAGGKRLLNLKTGPSPSFSYASERGSSVSELSLSLDLWTLKPKPLDPRWEHSGTTKRGRILRSHNRSATA